ncbi:hypothetical protein CLF_112186, partial [Clonorchis sinensis]
MSKNNISVTLIGIETNTNVHHVAVGCRQNSMDQYPKAGKPLTGSHPRKRLGVYVWPVWSRGKRQALDGAMRNAAQAPVNSPTTGTNSWSMLSELSFTLAAQGGHQGRITRRTVYQYRTFTNRLAPRTECNVDTTSLSSFSVKTNMAHHDPRPNQRSVRKVRFLKIIPECPKPTETLRLDQNRSQGSHQAVQKSRLSIERSSSHSAAVILVGECFSRTKSLQRGQQLVTTQDPENNSRPPEVNIQSTCGKQKMNSGPDDVKSTSRTMKTYLDDLPPDSELLRAVDSLQDKRTARLVEAGKTNTEKTILSTYCAEFRRWKSSRRILRMQRSLANGMRGIPNTEALRQVNDVGTELVSTTDFNYGTKKSVVKDLKMPQSLQLKWSWESDISVAPLDYRTTGWGPENMCLPKAEHIGLYRNRAEGDSTHRTDSRCMNSLLIRPTHLTHFPVRVISKCVNARIKYGDRLSTRSWLYGSEASVLNTDVMLSMMMMMTARPSRNLQPGFNQARLSKHADNIIAVILLQRSSSSAPLETRQCDLPPYSLEVNERIFTLKRKANSNAVGQLFIRGLTAIECTKQHGIETLLARGSWNKFEIRQNTWLCDKCVDVRCTCSRLLCDKEYRYVVLTDAVGLRQVGNFIKLSKTPAFER